LAITQRSSACSLLQGIFNVLILSQTSCRIKDNEDPESIMAGNQYLPSRIVTKGFVVTESQQDAIVRGQLATGARMD
jgi:hypothetical protein